MTFSSPQQRLYAPALRLLPGLAAHLARGFVPRVLSFSLLAASSLFRSFPGESGSAPVCVVRGARQTTHLSLYDGGCP